MIGNTLGHYEIVGLLGKGGMGEVYRARDSKLDREVAIKILPDVLAADPERLARFSREAKLLAAFNHPNIAGIYELGEYAGTHFLVLELVEGPDLDQLLASGTLDMDEILLLFGQLAEALEYAHERGVVHRDLKPANIKITGEGKVKVLDFGLGKATENSAISPGYGSGTIAMDTSEEEGSLQTAEGRILGTPAYMSPEQARGQAVDKRTDIWAFGCCLYEALTGSRTFRGATATDLLAEILKSDPDWSQLPGNTPARIRVLLWRCLQKDPRRRLRDIGEARIELSGEWSEASGSLPVPGSTLVPHVSRRAMFVATAVALVGGAVIAGVATWFLSRNHTAGSPSALRPVARFEIDIGRTTPLFMQNVPAEVAISPDGRRIAYTADEDGVRKLYLRDLDKTQSEPVPGTRNAWRPFFSPDGEWIGFFVPGPPSAGTGKLMKVSLDGRTPVELCNAFPPIGATWLSDDSIVFTGQDSSLNLEMSPFLSQLYRVSAGGGAAERLTRAEGKARGEWSHFLPRANPGEDFFLFTILGPEGRLSAALFDLNTGEHRTILEDALGAQYVDPGYIVFARGDALWAATFDPGSQVVGEPVVVQSGVHVDTSSDTAPFAVSGEGSLVFVPVETAQEPLRALVWVDHDGREETIAVPPGRYWWPRVSPDGSRVAMSIQDGNEDIWIHQFARPQSMTRVTFDPGVDTTPLWSPDSRYLYFASLRTGSGDLFRRRADGTGTVETIWGGPQSEYPADITPDGRTLLFGVDAGGNNWNIMALSLSDRGGAPSPGREPRPLLDSGFAEGGTKLSPDGRWLAYNTDETTPTQVFVRPFPDVASERWQVSTDGGINPTWSSNGKEIYYRHGNKMMAVAVENQPTFRPGLPRELFEADYYYAPDLSVQYDLEYPDRRRFLMIRKLPDNRTTKLVYVGNWAAELRQTLSPGP